MFQGTSNAAALPRVVSRTTAILEAVRKHLEERRAILDRADDLGELCVSVKLQAGTATVRSVNVSEERIVRRV